MSKLITELALNWQRFKEYRKKKIEESLKEGFGVVVPDETFEEFLDWLSSSL